MISFSEWIARHSWTNRPWLIIGKGPSFSRINQVDLCKYHTISLNHVVREVPVDVAHFIDLDAVNDSEEGIRKNAQWLLMPRFPHVDYCPADTPLETWLDQVPILREFHERDRLVCYSHIQRHHHGARLQPHLVEPGLLERYPLSHSDPLIPVSYFSGEAVVRVLASLGCRTVRTIGVDGGRSYSPKYSDLNTCLANGLPSFDWQFISISQTVKETNMDYGPWQEPIRVYVEKTSSSNVPFEVLGYSIRKFTSQPVEITPLERTMVPTLDRDSSVSPTGESLARFLIPKLSNYQGKAVYLQDTMLVLGDIAELLEVLSPTQSLQCSAPVETAMPEIASPRSKLPSIMVLDCAKLKWNVEEIYHQLKNQEGTEELCSLLADSPELVGFEIPREWNQRDTYEYQYTNLLHYTNEAPPWQNRQGSLAEIWHAFFRQALECGMVDVASLENGIARGDLSRDFTIDLKLAPERRSTVDHALAGTRSEQSRRQELERISLAAHLDQLHQHYADVRLHATQLEQKVNTMEQQYQALEHQFRGMEQQNQNLQQHCNNIEHQRQTSEEQRLAIETQKQQLEQGMHALQQRCQVLEQQNGVLQNQHQAAEAHCHELQQQNGAILSSYSLRIGILVTRPVRVMRSIWKGNHKDAA